MISNNARVIVHKDRSVTIMSDQSDGAQLFTAENGALVSSEGSAPNEEQIALTISWEDVKQALYTLAFTPSWEKEVELFILNNQRVAAIKCVRLNTGKGLKEAKDWVDLRYPLVSYPI